MNLICFQNIPLHILFYYITAKNTHLSEAVEFIEKESMEEQKDLKIWRNKTNCGHRQVS